MIVLPSPSTRFLLFPFGPVSSIGFYCNEYGVLHIHDFRNFDGNPQLHRDDGGFPSLPLARPDGPDPDLFALQSTTTTDRFTTTTSTTETSQTVTSKTSISTSVS